MKQRITKAVRVFLPFLGTLVASVLQVCVPDSPLHPVAQRHYYNGLLAFLALTTLILAFLSFVLPKLKKNLAEKGPFYLGAGILVSLVNLVTAKLALLPVIFFPTYDNILAIFIDQHDLLLKCTWYSFRLIFLGVLWGTLTGFVTGVLLGFSKNVYYWINPYIKLIGPIPATAWIPLVLTTFPTPFGASVFIISLAVWFPVLLMTSSGIQNTSKVYFEVGKTLGAGKLYQVFRIAVPAALPSIFQGVFTGICSAFIALMTAEMFGAKYGIGWYISWQKAMMMYSGVYAGLILIAIFCTAIITALFKIRGKLLVWQKGLIKW